MVSALEKQKIYQCINEMSMEELLELTEYTIRAMQNLHVKGSLQKEAKKDNQDINLYMLFETEFGRPLSPFEIETLNVWVDQDGHDQHLVKAALKEAVIAGKINLRYIDRILFDWKKRGFKTVKDAHDYSLKFRAPAAYQISNPSESIADPMIPLSNWLEG